MGNNYVCYHLHSDMSNGVTNIDSVTKFNEYIDKAKEYGMSAMAFSEHGSVFAWGLKKAAIEKAGMKYIHAEEFYVTQTLSDKVRDNFHCILIAKNLKGVKEINLLATNSFNRDDNHFYYVPRIAFDDLLKTSENVIITSACLGGILNHGSQDLKFRFLNFMSENNDRCFLEIQHHNIQEQKDYNKKLYDLSKKYNIKLIAGTDTHSLDAARAEGRVVLQKAKNIFFDNEEGWDLTFKSYEELVNAYKLQDSLPLDICIEAIENTNLMANMVETFEIDRKTKYPHIYDDPMTTFKKKINEGYKNNKYIKQRYERETVVNRIKEEVDVYEKVGAVDFMLLESYIRDWERSVGISCGPGRGSVSGSLVAYLLGITQMDSLRFNLNFFRFMNPSRVSNADIDTDYCDRDRKKIKEFLLKDKLNLPNIKTAEIITFNTIAMKGGIKEIARAMGISLDEAQELSDAVEVNDEKAFVIDPKYRNKYPELFKYVDIVKGTIVSIGTHPSGVLVSDRDIEEDVGLCTVGTSAYPVSMLDMHDLDDQMYVKLDILGLDNVGVINDACDLIGIDRLTPDNVNLEDENVWKSIIEDTTLIFQWESASAQSYLKRFMSPQIINKVKAVNKNFSYIKWFSFGNGLIRPGCASFRDNIANGENNITGFKEFDEFLAPTFGRITMQEDIMLFCKKFCGYSDAESDNVRRAIAKKKGTAGLLEEIHDRFVAYSHDTYGVDKELLESMFPPIQQGILDASSYAFSWNHSDAYSCVGYISGYLRYYYPLEFLTSALNIFGADIEKIASITQYAKKIGVPIKNIRFAHSGADYTCDKEAKCIYKGMSSIKFINKDVSEKLLEMGQSGKYKNFTDILANFPGDKKQLDILIRLGFFSDFGNQGKLLSIVSTYNNFNGRKVLNKDQCQIPVEIITKYANETEKQYRIFDIDGLMNELYKTVKEEQFTLSDLCAAESEFVGYISYKDPSMYSKAYVVDVDTKYSPKITIYCLDTGITKSVKMYKKSYTENPVQKGDIITYGLESKQKSRMDPNTKQWVKIPNEYENWFKWVSIRNKFDFKINGGK